MSIFRSLSGFLSSAIESPPNILAASRSFSLSSTSSSTSSTNPAVPSTTVDAAVSDKRRSSAEGTAAPTKAAAADHGTAGDGLQQTSATARPRSTVVVDEIPEVDLSYLNDEERRQIAAVMARANTESTAVVAAVTATTSAETATTKAAGSVRQEDDTVDAQTGHDEPEVETGGTKQTLPVNDMQ